ncbi:Hypothetical predicted protein, partial [Paramuricea clavata]
DEAQNSSHSWTGSHCIEQKAKGVTDTLRKNDATACHVYITLTWNGQPTTSSQINKAPQSVFKKATVSTKITSTSFRKAAATNIHKNSPEMSSKLASLMANNETTAKKYYLLTERTRGSVEASQKPARLMRVEPNTGETESGESASSIGDEETYLKFTKRVPWTNEELDKIKKKSIIQQHEACHLLLFMRK